MQKFEVEVSVASKIESIVKREPFEVVTFNEALKRLLNIVETTQPSNIQEVKSEKLENSVHRKSPRPRDWVKEIPELTGRFRTWKSICDHLNVEVGKDSARRRLKNWVRENKPDWPRVPNA